MNKHLRFSGSTFSKLEEHGVSASTVLRRAGLPQEYAKQPTVRLKTEELFALWRAIGEVSTNSAMGLLLALPRISVRRSTKWRATNNSPVPRRSSRRRTTKNGAFSFAGFSRMKLSRRY